MQREQNAILAMPHDELCEMVEMAIDDAIDLDTNSSHWAKSVVDMLWAHLHPDEPHPFHRVHRDLDICYGCGKPMAHENHANWWSAE